MLPMQDSRPPLIGVEPLKGPDDESECNEIDDYGKEDGPTVVEELVLAPDITDDAQSHHSEFSEGMPKNKPWGWQVVIRSDNKFRSKWNLIIFVMLVYIATLFPFRYTFVECKIDTEHSNPLGWSIVEGIIDALFWIDLFLNFFFTYTVEGKEIDNLCLIIKNYISGFFVINLVACLPPVVFTPIVNLFSSMGDSSANKLTRMSRLQRTTRLARLTRIGRLAVFFKSADHNQVWQYIKGTRGMRIVNFVGFLLWVVHLLACGWYLCATAHSDPEATWVARRQEADGTILIHSSSFVQWANAMYFVLTVFTTVGFGDMSATTVGEIFYVSFTMLVGVVVNSIIVGEVINIVNQVDFTQLQKNKTRQLVDGFASHCHLDKAVVDALHDWINGMRSRGDFSQEFDRAAMRDLVTTGKLPHSIVKILPNHIFGGRLERTKMISVCLTHSHEIPPRLTVLLALSLSAHIYVQGEVVYQLHENPFNVFLVHTGVFAFVGRPTKQGGEDEPASVRAKKEKMEAVSAFRAHVIAKDVGHAHAMNQKVVTKLKTIHLHPYKLFCPGNYFGDVEVLEGCSRHCTARCEGRTGGRDEGSEPTLLVLHKPDFFKLMEEFPQCANAWMITSDLHERRRLDALSQMTRGQTYKQLAACQIQRSYRKYREVHYANTNGSSDLTKTSSNFKSSSKTKEPRAKLLAKVRRGRETLNLDASASVDTLSTRSHMGQGVGDPQNIAALREDIRVLTQTVAQLQEQVTFSASLNLAQADSGILRVGVSSMKLAQDSTCLGSTEIAI